ncbi:hypothetical protein Tco_1432023 [Tanacetum coccineum]
MRKAKDRSGLVMSKQGSISIALFEVEIQKKSREFGEPLSICLLETIKGLFEFIDFTRRKSGVVVLKESELGVDELGIGYDVDSEVDVDGLEVVLSVVDTLVYVLMLTRGIGNVASVVRSIVLGHIKGSLFDVVDSQLGLQEWT